jgi:hypothetical protein
MSMYNKSSPFATTDIAPGNYLDIMEIRPVPKTADDVLYVIEPIFHQRPDLAADYIYGNHRLWWVFAQRNMDILQDPIFDFRAGTTIYLLNGPVLRELLGL